VECQCPWRCSKCTVISHRVAHTASAMAVSTNCTAWSAPEGGSIVLNTLRELPIVWCILSQIEFACGFLDVVLLVEMFNKFSLCWNAYPTNSPPWSCVTEIGLGYLDNQVFF
jgi:hypothetical protein